MIPLGLAGQTVVAWPCCIKHCWHMKPIDGEPVVICPDVADFKSRLGIDGHKRSFVSEGGCVKTKMSAKSLKGLCLLSRSRLIWYSCITLKARRAIGITGSPTIPGFTMRLWLECSVFPGRLERAVTKGKPTRWALFLLPCTGSKMRTIKFDTIHRALTGPDNTWLGRQNAGLKGGGWRAGEVSVTWKRVAISDTSRLRAK